MDAPDRRLTELLHSGTPESTERLLALVYDELRGMARANLARERPGHTLQATALVHEAFLRISGRDGELPLNDRRHFFAAAGEAMRRILIDQARNRNRLRRGGDHQRVDLEGLEIAIEPPSDDLLVVEEALAKLEAAHPRAREIVNLRYFTGLSNQETAEALGISLTTVEREWRFIRTYLQDVIERGGAG